MKDARVETALEMDLLMERVPESIRFSKVSNITMSFYRIQIKVRHGICDFFRRPLDRTEPIIFTPDTKAYGEGILNKTFLHEVSVLYLIRSLIDFPTETYTRIGLAIMNE